MSAVAAARPSLSQSRRCVLRARRLAAETSLTNSAISSLNSLHTNIAFSSLMQTRYSSTSPFLSASALRATAHVQSCAKRYVSRLAPTFRAGSSDGYDCVLRDTSDLFTASYAFTPDAVQLDADRVALPDTSSFVNLLDVLPEDVASRYAKPNPGLFRLPEDREPAPKACLVRSPADYSAIIRRMHGLGMVRFVRVPQIVNGCFGAPKADGKIRFVVDGRPAKAEFIPSPSMELPSPDLLARLEVPPGAVMYTAKTDLDNMFHRIRTPEWLHPYFALPPVRAGDVGVGTEFGDDAEVYPCCTTLPMGWSHSAYLAQVAHEHIVHTRTSLQSCDKVARENDFRLDRTRHSIYLDDTGFMGTDADDVDAKLDEYTRAMEAAGLPVKLSKTRRASADGMELIGVDIHGRDLTVGVHPSKLHQLARRTEAFLQRGKCTGKDMERLMGHWTWAVMVRRCVLSVFCKVYRFIEVAGKKTFEIWPSVARELRTAIGLAPLLFASLASPWFPKAIATDASDTGMGVVATPATVSELQEMSRARPPADNGPVDRSLHACLQGKRWADIVVSGWRYHEHINVLELRALDTAVRWCASFPRSIGCRLMMWCDSLVVVYACRKGRSSTWRLIRKLRTLSATLLATGMTPHVAWIPTEVNPADEPSRRVDLAAPDSARRPRFKFDSTLGYPGEGPGRRRFLINAAYEQSTRKRYFEAVLEFVDWMDGSGEDPCTVADLDEVLSEWFHDLYVTRNQACRSTAENALSGIHLLVPEVKGQLHLCRLALKGWRKLVPSVPHPPLTWDLAVCIGVRQACTGRWLHGVATLLAFDCYLRIGEFTSLTRGDVADAGDLRLGSGHEGMALRLRHTKTGPNQWVNVRNPDVITLVRSRLSTMPSRRKRARLFPFAPSTYRRHFKAACKDLGLSPDYVPHSLRHGGATHDHVRGMQLEEILRHGRWASVKSARHYVQAGRALLMSTSVPLSVSELAKTLVPNVVECFSLSQLH